MFEQRVYNA